MAAGSRIGLPPEPGRHATFARDHEYKRNGTVSLLAGIGLTAAKAFMLPNESASGRWCESAFNRAAAKAREPISR